MKPWVLTQPPWVGAPHFAFVTSLAVLPLLIHKPHQGFEHQGLRLQSWFSYLPHNESFKCFSNIGKPWKRDCNQLTPRAWSFKTGLSGGGVWMVHFSLLGSPLD